MPHKDPAQRRAYEKGRRDAGKISRKKATKDQAARWYRNAMKRRGKKIIADANRRREIHSGRNAIWILDFLSSHPCVDCGESDPIVLEFDHLDPATKAFNISKARREGYSLQRIQGEIKKCEVRCANCHRRRTVRLKHFLPKSRP